MKGMVRTVENYSAYDLPKDVFSVFIWINNCGHLSDLKTHVLV